MPNYNESMIYKLCCKDTTIDEIYIGSTISFRRRKAQHKICCNNINKRGHNRNVYQFIRDNGGWDNWDMILIAKVNCNDKMELRQKEREYMEEYKPSLNMYDSYRTYDEKQEYHKEYSKEYIKINKLKISTRKKEHYKTNKEEIHAKSKVKVSCECGAIIQKGSISTHRKTKKHINLMDTI